MEDKQAIDNSGIKEYDDLKDSYFLGKISLNELACGLWNGGFMAGAEWTSNRKSITKEDILRCCYEDDSGRSVLNIDKLNELFKP